MANNKCIPMWLPLDPASERCDSPVILSKGAATQGCICFFAVQLFCILMQSFNPLLLEADIDFAKEKYLTRYFLTCQFCPTSTPISKGHQRMELTLGQCTPFFFSRRRLGHLWTSAAFQSPVVRSSPWWKTWKPNKNLPVIITVLLLQNVSPRGCLVRPFLWLLVIL